MIVTREQVMEVVNIMQNKCYIDSPIDWFGQKAGLQKAVETAIDLYYKTASELHEDWRRGYIAKNADENGNYPPRWKAIKDQEFLGKLDQTNLPANIRLNEGVYEIDIAHSPFKYLSPDWQYENLEAAKIVACLVLRESVAIKGVSDLSEEEIGEIIHSEWLARNSWAKDDAVLSKPYAELPQVEQEKDIAQYKIALSAHQKMKENLPNPN